MKELDIFGAVLIIAASVLVVFSFQEAGLKTGSWSSAIFIVPLVIGSFCWIALYGWELLVAAKWEDKIATMFPLRLIKRRVYMGHFVSTLLAGFPYFVVIYSLPLRMQVVNAKSPLVAGVALLPMLGSVAIASTIAGAINTRRDLVCLTLLTGASFMLIGTAALSSLTNTGSIQSKMYGFEVFVGLGFGFMVSTVSLGASLECELRDRSESLSALHSSVVHSMRTNKPTPQ
jgi:MFS family permease